MKQVLIVGKGQIGQELEKQLREMGISSTFFTSHHHRHTFAKKAQFADVVFITISTKDRGQIALEYIMEAIALKRPVITCEKGALAYHFSTLRALLPKIGFNATVGGGSGILDILRGKTDKVVAIHAILNGTLNYLFSDSKKTAAGVLKDIETVLAEARTLGLCEPGSGNISQTIKTELTDVLLKMTIVANLLLVTDEHASPITPESFTYSHIDDYDFPGIYASGKQFVVSILKRRTKPPLPGISARIDGWIIHGGFVHQRDFPQFPFPHGANNVLQCDFSNNSTGTIGGVGAGVVTTANRMIRDAKILLKG